MQKRIGIIGGGASGALAALHCWRQIGTNSQIVIFEPASKLGRGKAYAGKDRENLLNVPADNMSAYSENPTHFKQWLLKQDSQIETSHHWPFVPRVYFGKYLEELVGGIPTKHLAHIRSKAVAVREKDGEYEVRSENGDLYSFQYLIIATGYDLGIKFGSALSVKQKKDHVLDATLVERWPKEPMSGHMLIVGAGLTALDTWKRLRKHPELSFTFLSRRGLFPVVHPSTPQGTASIELPQLVGMSPLQIFKILRIKHRSEGASWVALANQVRNQAPGIWSHWSENEKASFIRHAKPFWEVIRHRMPKTVADELKRDIDEGRASVIAGRIQKIEEEGEAFRVHVRPLRKTATQVMEIDWVALATGSTINQDLEIDREIRGLRACPHGFGFINEHAPRLWTVGPASKGSFWEITAVPDIRQQVHGLAMAIAGDRSQTIDEDSEATF